MLRGSPRRALRQVADIVSAVTRGFLCSVDLEREVAQGQSKGARMEVAAPRS